MADAYSQPPRAARLWPLGRLLAWAALGMLALVVGAQLVFFAIHAAHMLGYPFPLDYGEGPLLAQIGMLRGGTPIWQLYANPDQPPYFVVNYPPVYPLAAALAALLTGDALLAGRLVSLAATCAALAALWQLAQGPATANREARSMINRRFLVLGSRLLIVLSFLGLPIVREWAVVTRVDMLGVALGLWALALVRRGAGRRLALWAALPLALSLLVKPSLIAAPAAALVWLLFRDWRRALQLGALTAALVALVAGTLEFASGGWFALHVLAANANAWEARLAYGFWHDQLAILWPLLAAAGLGALFGLFAREPEAESQAPATRNPGSGRPILSSRTSILLALYYTIFGAVVAYGVGKVGAYTNYFLEFYAGQIWLAAEAAWCAGHGFTPAFVRRARLGPIAQLGATIAIAALLAGAQLRYYPLWSETYLKTAGLIEGVNPPRLALGRYGVWQDLRRERDLLAAFAKINAALNAEAHAAGGPLFTDIPGVAAQAGLVFRLQAFEYRQLLDANLADQRGLLRDLAGGRVPLVVLDYLGNWLTPEMITLITHRYAQAGSRGTYDIYRPVEPGPPTAASLSFAGGLRLLAFHLAPSPGRPAYHPGETALLTLDWRYDAAPNDPAPTNAVSVVVQLQDAAGSVLAEFTRPLLYGALALRDWGDAVVQHLQPLALPAELPPGSYRLALGLRAGERDLAAPQPLATLNVEPRRGRAIGERGYFVPEPLLAAWRARGGDGSAGPGDPIMPAVPFADGTLQCFARACLRFSPGGVQPLPLGELISLADAGLQPTGAGAPGTVSAGFQALWQASGGDEQLGPAIGGELIRGDKVVQYTRYARLERPLAGGAARLARLGDEFLRLPGGGPYRWPEYPPAPN